jgi:hypothetical protein|tara:strand:- start:384 stop:1565 length:1182 start_codon:yes stop_codon:yes gene_type:complete
MIENQAYIVALMLLIASPIAIASDEGQAVLERFSNTPDDLVDVEKNDRTEDLDDLLKEDIRDVVEDCYTIEQWKERLADYDWNKEDGEQESNEVREEEDGARGNSDDKEEKEDYNKETNKVTDKDCFTEAEFEEFVGKMGNKDRVDRDCVTVGQVREKWERIREGARDRDWGRDYDRDDDEDDRDDESDEGRDNDEDEGPNARGGDEEESDEDHGLNDEKRAELFAAIGELKEACEDGDEAACLELEELLEEYWKDWNQDEKRDWVREDRDDSECVGKHMMDRMKEKFGRDRGENDRDKDYDRDWERDNDEEWEELRAVMAELGAACDEGDEIACEELEELITELQNDAWERDEDCDEHDEHDEDDENNHDEEDEDDSEDEEDDSENDEPENA